MILGVPRETFPGERRVACVPASLPALAQAGFTIRVERGAGEAAGFRDDDYTTRGAELVGSRDEILAADAMLLVRTGAADRQQAARDLPKLRADQVLAGFCEPLLDPSWVEAVAARGARLVALEMVPRITRAQNVDALSSMATVAGYRAVLLAAYHLPKMFPLLMTAAGTITPAKVFVLGAGVAGLQAIATARRLGAVVEAYDLRPAVKEEVQSLGAKFVELPLDTSTTQDAAGYARAQDSAFYQRQAELLARVVAASDVVITTAAVPGKPAPRLITAEMVARMPAGSVLVDLAAERGGNCELTRPGETVTAHRVTVLGPTNLPSEVPQHASQLLSGNFSHLLTGLMRKGEWNLDPSNPLVAGMLLTAGGQVVHPQILERLAARRAPAL